MKGIDDRVGESRRDAEPRRQEREALIAAYGSSGLTLRAFAQREGREVLHAYDVTDAQPSGARETTFTEVSAARAA